MKWKVSMTITTALCTVFFDYLRPAKNWLYGELGDYFRQEGKEFAVQHPDLVSYDFDRHRCGTSSSFYDTIEECMMYYTFQDDFIVPWSVPYDRIWLRAGGADARRQEGGWASWTQVWPAMAASASGASGRFDVSEVDVTNFPELNCVEQEQMFLNELVSEVVPKALTSFVQNDIVCQTRH